MQFFPIFNAEVNMGIVQRGRSQSVPSVRFDHHCRLAWLAIFFFVSPSVGLAIPVFVGTSGPDGAGAVGGAVISMGVAPWLPPDSPGAPTYGINNFNGRNDILKNPGLGKTADPNIGNNTKSWSTGPWGAPPLLAGGPFSGMQAGGGNVNGPFGVGRAMITGPGYSVSLTDAGVLRAD